MRIEITSHKNLKATKQKDPRHTILKQLKQSSEYNL